MTAKDDQPAGQAGATAKRPYEAPAIAWQDTMEVRPGLLAFCQKIPGQGDLACDAVGGGFS
jgi:hypothetical protein